MKYDTIAKIIEQRVQSGDYVLSEIPSERELAVAHGVSHMTVRRAVEKLISDSRLVRKPNGRLAVNRQRSTESIDKVCNVAYLMPAGSVLSISKWHAAVTRAANELDIVLRPVTYVHWEDSAVAETLRLFDGVYMVSLSDPIPDSIREKLSRTPVPVVSLEIDLSRLGILSICPFPATCVRTLLDHLTELGHDRVACINTQPHSPDVDDRIAEWRFWCGLRSTPADLYDYPVATFGDPAYAAYELTCRLIEEGGLNATALLAVTAPVAMGCMRAFREAGIAVGRDISICAINDEGLARYLNPTLTSIEMIDLGPYVNLCMNWIKSGERTWDGPLVLQPSTPPLFSGGSTSASRSI